MAKQNKTQRNLKTTARMTPYDAKVAETFAEKERFEKAEPRRLTPAEVHANNASMQDLARILGDLRIWLPIFDEDLANMNRDKVGAPFKFSDAQILWCMRILSGFDGTFRITAGILQGLLGALGLASPSPSRLLERANELSARMCEDLPTETAERYRGHVFAMYISPNVVERERRVGIDGTGLCMSNANRWRLKKWEDGPKNRGWCHLHVLSDVDTGEFIGCILGDETVGDAPQLKPLVTAALEKGHRIEAVYGDGAYSSDENWRFLCAEKRIRFVTSFAINTRPTNNGCLARGEAARLWCSLPYDEWVRVSGYGTRWKCECHFSSFKTVFPETLTARSAAGIVRQSVFRVDFFNEFKDIRAKKMVVTGNGIMVG